MTLIVICASHKSALISGSDCCEAARMPCAAAEMRSMLKWNRFKGLKGGEEVLRK
jgi:hypothetical protein